MVAASVVVVVEATVVETVVVIMHVQLVAGGCCGRVFRDGEGICFLQLCI